MELARIAETLSPSQIVGETKVEIEDLAYDTRTVRAGALFFCVPGERFDGHDLAERARDAGAAALVVERPVASRVPQLVVADSRRAMATAAAEFFGHPTRELQVAGVTGTNGKTTTAYLLHSILDAAGRKPGLLGTIESRIGGERRPAIRTTPEAIDLQRTFRAMLDAGDLSCAMEATSHGSQLRRLDGLRFASLVFTNLTQDHLDLHGTMDAYFEAKRRLFVEGDRPPAAINVGDEWGRRLAADRPDALTYGFAEDAALRPDALEGIELKLRGRFNVENALAAMAGARLLGVDDDAVARGIEAVGGVPGRFESVDEGQPFTVIVDYAHTPDSLENVLATARELSSGRVICVFGCGGDRDREKRPVMGRIAGELADLPIVTSDNPRSEDPRAIIEEIAAGAEGELEVVPDRRQAIARAIESAEPGDVVVIAGKGHEQGQQFRDRTVPFDDREVAREALRKAGATA
ncbi:MAG: UDP-N-acetylmuramoyl-L-alanyl-D-glutamate--2,6-diaminopimelate ligase [Actinobacteria bacterium]|nr:MAG: UDP-N-acetylmuramoyl-L-alanyl-D-glutamate--2,6-diaminopimelate ligase [Actinomycetota bacterium]